MGLLMIITEMHWRAFELVAQNKMQIEDAAAIMGCPKQEVGLLLVDMKHEHPDLFPAETEEENVRRQLGSRSGIRVVAYNPQQDSQITKVF